jgi:ubiquitin thioesterase CYLD
MDCPDLEGDFAPPTPTPAELDRFLGKEKGIQGHHNSCYMDSMLFAMFSFSMVFDSVLFRPRRSDDIRDYDKVQKVLRESIVNPLRA